ncbi:MAG: YdcH family protein [Myxococcales bacterium]|nr:YdcH family protein [Myxococcales bacterium]
MRSEQRSIKPEVSVARLEKKHANLKQQIAALEGKGYLSEEDQLLRQNLKKQKLATKDELARARGMG